MLLLLLLWNRPIVHTSASALLEPVVLLCIENGEGGVLPQKCMEHRSEGPKARTSSLQELE